MFNEVLRIKPVLDTGAAKAMELSLSQRFGRVAKRFGGGLKSVIKGSILGISLGLLTKLLDPLEAVTEKIKDIMGQGTDLADMADRFGASPGEVKQLQGVASVFGVKPDELKDMILKFADGIEKARAELQDPFLLEKSESTTALKSFVGEKNLVKSFEQFLSGLKAQGQGPGSDLFFGEKERTRAAERLAHGQTLSPDERADLIKQGFLRQRTGIETRQANERAVFGENQFGPARRLIEADLPATLKQLGGIDIDKFNAAAQKIEKLAEKQRILEFRGESKDFINASGKLNDGIIKDLEAAKQRDAQRVTDQLDSYKNMKRAADGVAEISGLLFTIRDKVLYPVLGYIKDIADVLVKIKGSRLWMQYLGGK
jgi:hypothetical protein